MTTLNWLNQVMPCVNIVGGALAQSGCFDPERVIYDHELMAFSTGRHRIELADGVVECPENSFVIIPPGVWHSGHTISGRQARRVWIHFDWAWQPIAQGTPIMTYRPAEPQWRLIRAAPACVPRLILHGPLADPAEFFAQHARMTERFNVGSPKERLACRAAFFEMLIALLVPDEAQDQRRGATERVMRIRAALQRLAQQRFADAERIRACLEGLGESYGHQARLFKRAAGVGPLQYVNALRIERARRLLRESDRPVASIAAELGFSDPVYFIRLFRKIVGVTPGAYR